MLLRQRSSCLGLARLWVVVCFFSQNSEGDTLKLTYIKAPAYRRYARGAQKCYKPITTRLPFLSGVLILTLALIAIVEIVLLQYPVDDNLGPLAAPNITRRFMFDNSEDETIGIDGILQHVHLNARVPSVSVTESSASSSPADSSTSDISASTQTGPGTFLSLQSPPPTSFLRTETSAYIPPSAYIPTSRSLPQTAPSGYLPTYTSIPGAYIPTTQPPSVETTITLPNGPSVNTPTSTTTQPAYIPSQPPPLGTGSGAGPSNGGATLSNGPGAHVPTSTANAGVGTQVTNVPTSTINDPNAVATSLIPLSTLTSGGTAVVVLGTPSKTLLVPVSTYTSNGVALVVMGSPSKTPMVPVSTYTSNGYVIVVMGSPTKTSLVPVSTMTSNGVAVVVLGLPTSQPTTSAVLSSGYSVVIEPVTSTSGSVAYVYMTTITLSPSQLASQTATATTPQNTASTTSDQQKTTIAFTNISYFAAWYLPTIIAVAFRVLWTIVYNNARMMEPFYRLASPPGVTGSHALDTL
jgi:Protein of unknown function (DUF3433)